MNKCPKCGKPGFTLFKRLFIGPGRSIKCRFCGSNVSVSQLHFWISLLPFIIAYLLGKYCMEFSEIKWTIWVLGLTMSLFANIIWVPLIYIPKRENLPE